MLELDAAIPIGVLHDPYSDYSDDPRKLPSKKLPLRKDFSTFLARPNRQLKDSVNLEVEAVTPQVVKEAHDMGLSVMAWFSCVCQARGYKLF